MNHKSEDSRPTDSRTGKPIGPLSQPGYYPGFHTLDNRNYWDAKTREVVLHRVQQVPPIRFFTAEEARLLEAITNRVLPQDDRDQAHRIPIVPRIDERLFTNRLDGYRFEDMPSDQEAFRIGIKAIDVMARAVHGRGFVDLGARDQELLLKSLHDGDPPGDQEVWKRLPLERFWTLLVQDCAEAYYAHPLAWDEVGFGGPAYPRGYMRLEGGEPEPWEVDEKRYEWKAPEQSVSDVYEPVGGLENHKPTQGQGGTH